MVRVGQNSALIRTGPAPSGYDQKLSTKPSKHKVVLESVTQEKKKLRSVLSFKAEPPKGYTFIPAGNPELTNALKDFARKGNHEIYAVSTTPHQRAHDLSQQVHRIGFHFPSVVVAQVCAYYGIVLTSAGTVLVEDELESFHPRSKRSKEQITAQERKDQITINTEARDTIKDLFPNIPDNDLNQIIKTAFQKGQGKVGTANELSLIRRAQLAVVAHIRHVYTDYDKLLRQTHYREARNFVEKPSLRKLVEWRGDDENGKQVLEDVFREVVVISDDEDSDREDEDTMNDFRDVSVEIVSSNTKADHFNPDPLVLEAPNAGRKSGHFPVNSKRHSAYPHNASSVQKVRKNDQDKVSRRGFSRYQAWNEAREEYRANPTDIRVVNERAPTYPAPEVSLRRVEQGLSGSGHHPETFTRRQHLHQSQDIAMQAHNDPLDTFRARDGTLYERVIENPSPGPQHLIARPLIYETRRPAAVGRVRSNAVADFTYRQDISQNLSSPRDTIIPSIEDASPAAASSQSRMVSVSQLPLSSNNERWATTTNQNIERRVNGIEYLDLTDESPYLKKRRRVENISGETFRTSRTADLAPYSASQQHEPEYISLLSPTHQPSQPSNTNAPSALHYEDPHNHVNVSTSTPTYRDTGVHNSSVGVMRSGEKLVARRPHGQVSGLGTFPSREVRYLSPSSPRIDKDSLPIGSQSAFHVGASPVDRGIQQYRAFRAREQQEKALSNPSGPARSQLQGNGDVPYAAIESRNGRPRQFDATKPSRDLSSHLSQRRATQGYHTLEEPLPLAQEDGFRLRVREVDRDHSLRRRSASPIEHRRTHLGVVPSLPQSYHERRLEAGPEYLSMERDDARQSAHPGIMRPIRRYE